MIRRRVTVLGSTGSVGSSTLDLMAQAEATGTGVFEVEALTGGANIAKLAEQARREEIARMLAGASITEEARAAAGRLLEAAGLRG